jgi:hypothetical protein
MIVMLRALRKPKPKPTKVYPNNSKVSGIKVFIPVKGIIKEKSKQMIPDAMNLSFISK